MKARNLIAILAMCFWILVACQSTPIPPTAIATNTNAPPTASPIPTNTVEPTALPGKVIYPSDSLDYGIPWMPIDKTTIPMVTYYGFNTAKPPFNIPEVRQAFAAAIDAEVLTLIYERGNFYNNETPASSVIPPETLSLDLYGDVGIQYDPELAKQLLAKAGYEDASNFPEISMLLVYVEWFESPGIAIQAAKEAVKMWEENLGVTVNLEVIGIDGDINEEKRQLMQTGKYAIFESGMWANENDPNDFVYSLFHPNGYHNLMEYSNGHIAKLIANGKKEVDPAKRLPIYLEIDQILSEEELPIIPLFHCTIDLSQYD